jgi:hypothetical protein
VPLRRSNFKQDAGLAASAELANLEGVDVLLEGNGFAAVHGPHVNHLHHGRFPGILASTRSSRAPRLRNRAGPRRVTDDAIADWMTYLWSYRRFALREPHLYGVMFGPGLAAFRLGDPADLEAARSTFVSLLRRIHACVNAGRWQVGDVTTAGEAVWSGVHGHTTLELTGFFGSVGRDPVRSYSEILTRMSIGLGDHALATARSLSTARRRAVRADRAEATHLG